MKRFNLFILFALIGMMLSFSIAWAVQGRQPKDGGGVTIQNAAALAPVPAAARCDTVTLGVQKNYSTAGYTQAAWTATNTSGTAVVVKRYLNSNTAYMPGSSGAITNDKPYTGGWAVQKIGLKTFTNMTAVYCVDRQ